MKQVVGRKGVWFITQKKCKIGAWPAQTMVLGERYQIFGGHLLCGYYSILKREFNIFEKF